MYSGFGAFGVFMCVNINVCVCVHVDLCEFVCVRACISVCIVDLGRLVCLCVCEY